MDETQLKKIHEIVDCMNDIGMLDSYWDEIIRIDIVDNLDYWIKSKIDSDAKRKIAKLNNLLKEIEEFDSKEK